MTGTAIGGGFLALPHAVAPAGFFPSAAVMVICWLVLLVQARLCVDLICVAHKELGNHKSSQGYWTLARRTGGVPAQLLVGTIFLCLIVATLVSQIAKIGEILASCSIPYGPACAAAAGILTLFTLAGSTRIVSSTNAFLTVGFAAAALRLFAAGSPAADWSRLALWDSTRCWRLVPTILQLFVFHEVLPNVCHMLNYEQRRIHRAVLLGSSLLFLIELSWAALGLGLVPLSAVQQASNGDPINVLLAQGGTVATTVLGLAVCAITTTIIGTNLALQAFFGDLGIVGVKRNLTTAAGFLVVATAAFIAACSPVLFFAAIDFAGAYPVAILWGILPALACLRSPQSRERKRTIPVFMAVVSTVFVLSNTAADVQRWLGVSGGAPRWH